MVEYSTAYQYLKETQEVEHDNRERIREIDHFLNKKDGQWEPRVRRKMSGRPRYTFDRCNVVVDDIMGQLEQASFSINISASGGGASKEQANARNGIIRKSEHLSGARYIYNAAGRKMVACGMSGWRVVSGWADDKSFFQDLLIKRISNYEDRVWLDCEAEEPDASDAKWGFVLTSMTMRSYKKKWPKGSGESVSTESSSEVYSYKKPDEVIVGEYLYQKPEKTTLILMSNNAVYKLDKDFLKVRDELAKAGVTVKRDRDVLIDRVFQKEFDGSGWLGDSKPTPFQYIPVVPVYGNFEISERKVIYRGAVQGIMDPQRVLNYSESRQIEDGALAPKPKIMMTEEQMEGFLPSLQTMNINSDPVQGYNHVDGQPQPYKLSGPEVNQSLANTSASMNEHINLTSGAFKASKDQGLGVQSGVALDRLQSKEDNTNFKYFLSMEIAVAHTGRIMNDAIPSVYDTKREMGIRNADGTETVIKINDSVYDEQTREVIKLNDMSSGIYAVDCTTGPAFKDQQRETTATIIEMSKVDPSIIQMGADIILNNTNAPGMKLLAERKRAMMVSQGVIPDNQLTEEEKVVVAAQKKAQAEQGPNPMEQAMLTTAQAELTTAQAKAAETQSKMNERLANAELKFKDFQRKQQELMLKAQIASEKARTDQTKAMTAFMESNAGKLKTMAETLNLLREAMGVESVRTEAGQLAYKNQAGLINVTQRQVTQP